jgi:hypothetical protein
LRGAFDAACALPGPEFLGLPPVFVVHNGVEFLHVVSFAEDLTDKRGVFAAFLE